MPPFKSCSTLVFCSRRTRSWCNVGTAALHGLAFDRGRAAFDGGSAAFDRGRAAFDENSVLNFFQQWVDTIAEGLGLDDLEPPLFSIAISDVFSFEVRMMNEGLAKALADLPFVTSVERDVFVVHLVNVEGGTLTDKTQRVR